MSRPYCQQCVRPQKVCLCSEINEQANTHPVLILQHEDESIKPLSTVPLIKMGLSNTEVFSGLNFTHELCEGFLTRRKLKRPLLIYPKALSSHADHLSLDCKAEYSEKRAVLSSFDCFIVLDGTWRNTRELILSNPWLLGYPTLALENTGASFYRIRQAKQEGALSTIEAVASVLKVVDEAFQPELLLKPFVRMIDQQIECMGEDTFLRNYS